jgi:BNR/Asp-box repeat
MTTTHSPGTSMLLAGTKRGLFLLSSDDRRNWSVDRQLLSGTRIYNAIYDARTGRMFAADNGDFFGTFLRYSDDFGETWVEPRQGIEFPEDSGLKLENIWTIVPGRADEPDTIYAGVAPASLWVSHDRGETWEPNAGLMNHPTRERWQPGAGGLCLHTIVPDYSNKNRMWIGTSAVGCMRTDDGGETWTHLNRGTRAGFMPDQYPEYGQCLHRMVQHPTQPDVLYQQNHCGIYKTTDAAETWTDIQGELPSEFGFPIALDRNNPDTVFVIVEDGMARNNVGESFTVYRTGDGGNSWERTTNGLPSGAGVKLGVLRHGMCSDTHDPCGVYVGTNTGQIFATTDSGEHWNQVADYLPPVYSVNAVTLA